MKNTGSVVGVVVLLLLFSLLCFVFFREEEQVKEMEEGDVKSQRKIDLLAFGDSLTEGYLGWNFHPYSERLVTLLNEHFDGDTSKSQVVNN